MCMYLGTCTYHRAIYWLTLHACTNVPLSSAQLPTSFHRTLRNPQKEAFRIDIIPGQIIMETTFVSYLFYRVIYKKIGHFSHFDLFFHIQDPKIAQRELYKSINAILEGRIELYTVPSYIQSAIFIKFTWLKDI